MSEFVDRRNLDFVLFEMPDLDTLLTTPRYEEHDRESITAMLDVVEGIAETNFLPFAAKLDANEPKFVDGKVEIIPEVGEALSALGEAGLFAAGFDEAIGGLQLPWVVTTNINGIFTAANLSVANYAFLTVGAANMLNAFGTDEQKDAYLPNMLAGKWFGTMCLSEPQAGSSLADIKTKAVRKDDGTFSLSGSKMWISGGDHDLSDNIIHMVLARIEGAPVGTRGISLFIVPRYRLNEAGERGEWNNIALAGLNHKMGQRGTTNCLLNFGESGETVGYLLGEENKGLACMFHMMNEARVGVGQASVMSALAGYLHAVGYARERPQGRPAGVKDQSTPQVPIIEHTDVRRMLMAQKAAVEGGLSLTSYCSLLVDKQKTAETAEERAEYDDLLGLLTPVAKSWPSEHCLEANKWAIQILGGYGYTRDYPVERHYRDNRLNHIHEGTFGIQGRDLLGRKLRAGVSALTPLRKQIASTIETARAQGLNAECDQLEKALTSAEKAIEAVRGCEEENLSLANATLFLDAFGTVVVAWLWLWQASVAKQASPDAGSSEETFYNGKIAAAQYFFRYELSKVFNTLELVASLDDTCELASADFFGVS